MACLGFRSQANRKNEEDLTCQGSTDPFVLFLPRNTLAHALSHDRDVRARARAHDQSSLPAGTLFNLVLPPKILGESVPQSGRLPITPIKCRHWT